MLKIIEAIHSKNFVLTCWHGRVKKVKVGAFIAIIQQIHVIDPFVLEFSGEILGEVEKFNVNIRLLELQTTVNVDELLYKYLYYGRNE